jgi:hypothetical protein
MTTKQKLDSLFYGKDLMTKGFKVFKDAVKSLKIPDKDLKFYYDNQEIVQLFKPIPPRKERKFIPIVVSSPFERVYMDTMFITGINLTIVNCVDLFSKYGFSMSFRGNSISSSKALKTLYSFIKHIIDAGYYITNLITDSGTEFKGEFKKDCKGLGIDLKYTDVNDKLQASPIESYNRTIRLGVEKLKAMSSSKNPITSQIEKGLVDIINSYNDTKHSATGFSPMEILNNPDIQNDVYIQYSLKKANALKDYKTIPVGSFVRVALNERSNPFQKLSPNWSKEIYKIKEYDVPRNRYVLEGKDGFFEYWKLQVIDKDNLMKHTVERYVVSNPVDDDVKKSRAQKQVEKETKDYLEPGKYYKEDSSDKRKKKKKVVLDL